MRRLPLRLGLAHPARRPAAARSWRCRSSGLLLGRIAAILPLLGCSAILDYPAKQATDSGTDFPVDTPADSPVDSDVTDTPDDTPADTVEDDGECTGFRVRIDNVDVSPSGHDAYNASLVWTGSEYGLAWYDDRDTTYEVFFARLDEEGARIGSDTMVSDTGGSSVNPSLVFSGTEYAVAWQEGASPTRIHFARLDASGTKIGSTAVVVDASSAALYPAMAWSGSEYMLAWHDDREGMFCVYYARMSASGVEEGVETKLNATGTPATYASIAWGGSRFAIAWDDTETGPRQIYAAIVAPWGNKEGSDVRVSTAGISSFASIAWSGSDYALLWQDTRAPDSEIFMRRMSNAGALPGSEAQLTTSAAVAEHPAVVWAGSAWGLAWNDSRSTVQQVYIGLADPAGARIGGDLRVADAFSPADEPSLAWTGSEFGVAWSADRSGGSLIFFSVVGPCP